MLMQGCVNPSWTVLVTVLSLAATLTCVAALTDQRSWTPYFRGMQIPMSVDQPGAIVANAHQVFVLETGAGAIQVLEARRDDGVPTRGSRFVHELLEGVKDTHGTGMLFFENRLIVSVPLSHVLVSISIAAAVADGEEHAAVVIAGTTGEPGPLDHPVGIAVHPIDRNFLISSKMNHRLFMGHPSASDPLKLDISPVSHGEGPGHANGVDGTFAWPTHVAAYFSRSRDHWIFLVVEEGGTAVRMVDFVVSAPSVLIENFAGSTTQAASKPVDASLVESRFLYLRALSVAHDGTVMVVDGQQVRIIEEHRMVVRTAAFDVAINNGEHVKFSHIASITAFRISELVVVTQRPDSVLYCTASLPAPEIRTLLHNTNAASASEGVSIPLSSTGIAEAPRTMAHSNEANVFVFIAGDALFEVSLNDFTLSRKRAAAVLSDAWSIVVTTSFVLISVPNANQVQRLSTVGIFRAVGSNEGVAGDEVGSNGLLNQPRGLAIVSHPKAQLTMPFAVADSGNRKIKVFELTPFAVVKHFAGNGDSMPSDFQSRVGFADAPVGSVQHLAFDRRYPQLFFVSGNALVKIDYGVEGGTMELIALAGASPSAIASVGDIVLVAIPGQLLFVPRGSPEQRLQPVTVHHEGPDGWADGELSVAEVGTVTGFAAMSSERLCFTDTYPSVSAVAGKIRCITYPHWSAPFVQTTGLTGAAVIHADGITTRSDASVVDPVDMLMHHGVALILQRNGALRAVVSGWRKLKTVFAANAMSFPSFREGGVARMALLGDKVLVTGDTLLFQLVVDSLMELASAPAEVCGVYGDHSSTVGSCSGNARFDGLFGIDRLDAETVLVTELRGACISRVELGGAEREKSSVIDPHADATEPVDGAASDARVVAPGALRRGRGLNFYFADGESQSYLRVLAYEHRTVKTIAGSAAAGSHDGFGLLARFSNINFILFAGSPLLYIADGKTFRAVVVTGDRAVCTVAGGLEGFADAEARPGGQLAMRRITAAVREQGSDTAEEGIRFIEEGNLRLRQLVEDQACNHFAPGTAAIFAGSGVAELDDDDDPEDAAFSGQVTDITVCRDKTDVVYVLEGGHLLRRASALGVTTFSTLQLPTGITLSMIACDASHQRLLATSADYHIVVSLTAADDGGLSSGTTLTSAILFGVSQDAAVSESRLSGPEGVTTDGQFVFVTEPDQHIIRKFRPGDVASGALVAGVAGEPGVVDANELHTARFNRPRAIRYDALRRSLYIMDEGNGCVRRIDLALQLVTRVLGRPSHTHLEPPTHTSSDPVVFTHPRYFALSPDGALIVSDGDKLLMYDGHTRSTADPSLERGELLSQAHSAVNHPPFLELRTADVRGLHVACSGELFIADSGGRQLVRVENIMHQEYVIVNTIIGDGSDAVRDSEAGTAGIGALTSSVVAMATAGGGASAPFLFIDGGCPSPCVRHVDVSGAVRSLTHPDLLRSPVSVAWSSKFTPLEVIVVNDVHHFVAALSLAEGSESGGEVVFGRPGVAGHFPGGDASDPESPIGQLNSPRFVVVNPRHTASWWIVEDGPLCSVWRTDDEPHSHSLTAVVGGGCETVDGDVELAKISAPRAATYLVGREWLLIAEMAAIRALDPGRALLLTIWGSDRPASQRDGDVFQSRMSMINAMMATESGNVLYLIDGSLLRRLSMPQTRRWELKTLHMRGVGFRDGPLWRSRFREPTALVLLGESMILVGDSGNRRIRAIHPPTQRYFAPPTGDIAFPPPTQPPTSSPPQTSDNSSRTTTLAPQTTTASRATASSSQSNSLFSDKREETTSAQPPPLPTSLTRSGTQSSTQTLSGHNTASHTRSKTVSQSHSCDTSSRSKTVSTSVSRSASVIANPHLVPSRAIVRQEAIRSSQRPREERTATFELRGSLIEEQGDVFHSHSCLILSSNAMSEATGFTARRSTLLADANSVVMNATHIVVAFAHDPDYYVVRSEQVALDLQTACVATRKVVPVVHIMIEAPQRVAAPQAVHESATAIAAASAALGGALAVSGASAAQAARSVSILAIQACAYDYDQQLSFMMYPLGVPLGSDPLRFYAGAALLNPAMLTVIVLLHVWISWIVSDVKKTSFRLGLARCRMPSFTMLPVMLLMQDSISAAVAVMIHSSNQNTRIVAGVVCALWTLLAVGSSYALVSKRIFGAWFDSSEAAVEGSAMRSFFFGQGQWNDDDLINSTNTGYCSMFSSLFGAYKEKRRGFFLFELFTISTCGVIAGIHPARGECSEVAMSMAISLGLYFLVLCIALPYYVPFQMCVAALSALLQAGACVSIVLADRFPSRFDALGPTASYATVASMYVAGARTLVEAVLLIMEITRPWAKTHTGNAGKTASASPGTAYSASLLQRIPAGIGSRSHDDLGAPRLVVPPSPLLVAWLAHQSIPLASGVSPRRNDADHAAIERRSRDHGRVRHGNDRRGRSPRHRARGHFPHRHHRGRSSSETPSDDSTPPWAAPPIPLLEAHKRP